MRSSKLGYNNALDGLRGVAILLVIGRHVFPSNMAAGIYGVDVFFVLSGFLITTLLLEEHDATGSISLTGFYRRRARRLLPALVVMLTAFLGLEIVKGHVAEGIRATVWGALYTTNIATAWFPHEIGNLPVSVLWSLAQEEQFYLLAPLGLLLLIRRRVRPAVTMWLLVGLITAVTAEGVVLSLFGTGGNLDLRIYTGPDTHSSGLLVGMLLAFGLRRPSGRHAIRFNPRLDGFSLLLLIPAVSVLMAPFAFQVPFVNLAAAGLICCACCQPHAAMTKILGWGPLAWIGKISYGLYIWQMLMLWLFAWNQREIAIAATFVVAALSYKLIEQPLRRGREKPIAAKLALALDGIPATPT